MPALHALLYVRTAVVTFPRHPLVDDLFMLLRHAKAERMKIEASAWDTHEMPRDNELFAILRRVDATVEAIEAQAWDDINREST
jgi:hypothetical protein